MGGERVVGSISEGRLPWWARRRQELLELADAQTPLFVYDEATLDEAAAKVTALGAIHRVLYAVKANAHPGVLARLHDAGLGFECVSPGELALVTGLFDDLSVDELLFTPSFAPRSEYEDALEGGLRVTVDSLHPLEAWPELFRDREIFVRLDPGRARGHHAHVRTAGAESKFGVDPGDLDALEAAARRARARVVGLHAHVGSGILAPESWAETARFLSHSAQRFDSVRVLDLGGGLGVPDAPGQSPLDLNAVDGSLEGVRDACPGLELWLEPGRFLVADAGVLLGRVTQVKDKGDLRYVGVDVGMNSLIRPALYGAHHEIVNLSRLDEPATEVAHVVGPICETGDTLGRGRPIAPAREGDVLLVATAGAYGRVMSSSYNLRPPAEERVLKARR